MIRTLPRTFGIVFVLALAAGCGDVKKRDAPAVASSAFEPGKALYEEHCAMCHGPKGMGTGLLARRTETPLLEERTDLTPDFVVQAARTGILNMPAIPRGEVSDPELAAIGDYLSRSRGAP